MHAERDIITANPSVRLCVGPSVRLSNVDAVSKRTDTSSHFFDNLVGTSLQHFEPGRRYEILRRIPQRGVKYMGCENFANIAFSFVFLNLGNGTR